MLSSSVLSVFLVVAFIASTILALPAILPSISESIVSSDVSEVKDLPQGVELTALSPDLSTKGLIRYTLGQRVPNDKEIEKKSSSVAPSEGAANIYMRLKYPGETTFVQIDIKQKSSMDSQAYAVSKSGQEGIDIIVLANNITYFGHTTTIYGIKK